MAFLYIIISSLAVIFLESFLIALCNFRIFFLVVLLLFKKINWKYILIFAILTSLILDVVYHYILGTNLLILAIPLLVMLGISLLIPIDNTLPGYVVKLFCIILYYFLVYWIPNLLIMGNFQTITFGIIVGIVLKSIFSLGICVVFDILWGKLRKKETLTKLRLGPR